MEFIKIKTTQNVDLRYTLASLGSRISAYLLDTLILYGYLFIVYEIIQIIESSFQSEALIITSVFILASPYIFYYLFMEYYFNGQSIGKKALKIKVVKLDGTQPGLGEIALRWVFRIIDIPLGGSVAVLSIVINEKGQRLGDMAAGTTVVKLRDKVKIDDIKPNEIKDLDFYNLRIKNILDLNDEDIRIVSEVLKAHKENKLKHPELNLLKTKRGIEARLGISSDIPSLRFLESIIEDYNLAAFQRDK